MSEEEKLTDSAETSDPAKIPDPIDDELQQFAIDFILNAVKLGGVRIVRDSFLNQELQHRGYSTQVIKNAIATTPLEAGVEPADLDRIANRVIRIETSKSTFLSFASGLPGGFAMIATVPGDILQYFVYAFRIMQKLAYVYGWKDFISDLNKVDYKVLAKFALFLGVMLGTRGASNALATFAKDIAQPAIRRQIERKALSRTVWYGPMKHALRLIGVKVSKRGVANTVSKIVPVVSGFVSGAMTFTSLYTQSHRLHKVLRELPAPSIDELEFQQMTAEQTPSGVNSPAHASVTNRMKNAVSAVSSKLKATQDIWFG